MIGVCPYGRAPKLVFALGSQTSLNGPGHVTYGLLYGPLPSGDYLLLVIDRYSRSPEEEVVRSTKASCVIPKLDIIFAVHGIPIVIETANVPPFNGEEYKRYGEALGIN